MIISIINRTDSLRNSEVQRVIRAINRQLREDFKLHWHRDVQLRLEGNSGGSIDEQQPVDMRGNAVMYLWDKVNVDNALGFHDLNHKGVPYGFVFTELSKQLGEAWSVTLSHEVLELAVDPEVNLFARGPDPENPARNVMHWYELCDAVQTQTYMIDEIEVSNFVLPLYFTAGEEMDGHNDFLGKLASGERLKSFGVAPGGYIGYLEPETNQHNTFTNNDPIAVNRNKVKNQARAARRGIRYQQDHTINNGSNELVEFEAITFAMKDIEESDSLNNVHSLVRNVLGEHWRLESVAADKFEFDAFPITDYLSIKEAWGLSKRLQEEDNVEFAEPQFTEPLPGILDEEGFIQSNSRRSRSWSSTKPLPATKDREWSLSLVNAQKAWELFPMNKKPGQGVRIGHPDSGFRPHKELDSDRLLTGIDYDFYQGDDNPQVSSGGHGLGTASVIMSGVNRSQDGDYVIGTAPYSELIPLRVTSPGKIRPAPVLTFKGMHRLRDAIDHAVAHECHVISISLGGFPSKSVKKALKRANKKGVIVLAAAGNRVRTVVWPARYSRAISVAGCNIERKPWVGSSRGKKVDVSAPAESVWKAEYNKQGKPVVGQSDGTSFAVATTAGVAALWLSYHGRDKLIARYGEEQLPLVFKKLLKLSCAHSPYLSTDKFGEGIVDAKALLEMELPNLNNDSLVDKAEDEIDENSLAEEVASIIGENEERVKAAIASHEDELYFHMAHSDLKDSLLPLSSTQRRNISNLSSKVGGERQNFSGGLLKILSAEIGIEAKK